MKLLGITGGIGMGKSTAGSLLEKRGIPVIDTDLLARQLVEPGQPALGEIVQLYGPSILDAQGALKRSDLARRVFSTPELRQKLEAILHPKIREAWLKQTGNWRSQNIPLGAVIIPLLFETDAQKEFDHTLCLACSHPTQMQRLQARDWSTDAICQRIKAQWPIEKKIDRSDFVIWTEGPVEILAAQLEQSLTDFLGDKLFKPLAKVPARSIQTNPAPQAG
jgi:dephospho-CoA kinase